MTSGRSSVPLVVRLNSTRLPASAARRRAYGIVFSSTAKFSSVSPPKNVSRTTGLPPERSIMKSTLSRAVSSLISFGMPPAVGSAILSSPYS